MEIIKAGDPSRLQRIREFECKQCGCIFKACDAEYTYSGMQYNISYYKCACPTCGETVYCEG